MRAAERESLRQLLGTGAAGAHPERQIFVVPQEQQDDITLLIVKVTNAALCVKQIALPL